MINTIYVEDLDEQKKPNTRVMKTLKNPKYHYISDYTEAEIEQMSENNRNFN